MVVKNADAIERALRAGDRRVKDSLGRYGDAILRDFRLSVSVPYPPPSAPGTPPHLRTGEYRLALAHRDIITRALLAGERSWRRTQ
jgi:hypothetical protein